MHMKSENLKQTLKRKIDETRLRVNKLHKEFGSVKIDDVTIGQCLGGARDIPCLVSDISYLDPHEGIRFHGKKPLPHSPRRRAHSTQR